MRRKTQRQSGQPPVRLLLFFLLSGGLLWILFVGGTQRNEMLVGLAVLLLSSVFALQIWLMETIHVKPALQDILQGWRIPWYILTKDYEIIAILLKDLAGRRAHSYYRVSGFKTGKSDPRLVARRVLATFYTTMAPNFIVIGIDFRQSRMLFHQLERSSIARMTKALGAQPGTGQP